MDRHTNGWTLRRMDIYRQTYRRMDIQTDGHTDKWIYRWTDTQMNGYTDKQTCKWMDTQTDEHTDGLTYRQMDIQMDGYTNTAARNLAEIWNYRL